MTNRGGSQVSRIPRKSKSKILSTRTTINESILETCASCRPWRAGREEEPGAEDTFRGHCERSTALLTMRDRPIRPRPNRDALRRKTLKNSLKNRRIARRPELKRKLRDMAIELSPLVQITTGHIHPSFPRKMLQFWLLTDRQLEDMAHFYHQRTPSTWSSHYPCPVTWNSNLSLEEKRRKIGKFIGLRGCDTPVWLKSEDEIAKEARQARIADEEEMWKRKMNPGRG